MPTSVKMPQLGESVVEGTVARWLKAPGETVAKLEPLLEISTDKIDTEVPSPAEGTLLSVVVQAGETVAAGAVLAYIGAAGEAVAPPGDHETSAVDAPVSPAPAASSPPGGRVFVSPVVARIAAENRVDLETIVGSGLGGRITKKDLLAHLAQTQASTPTDPQSETEMAAPNLPAVPDDDLHADEHLQPLSTMRRAIARHMVQSQQTSAHVTTIFEADMTAVVRHRAVHKAALAAKGIELTFTPYLVAAAVAALKAVPQANSRFSEAGIALNRRLHIGVAVAVPQGLIVPVIRDADEKNLQGLARIVNDLRARGRDGTLTPDDVQGGTFTVTNHGTGGSLVGTPIIHQPQAAILGVGAIVKRPVVRPENASLLPSADDAIVIRPMCYLSLTFDHRILDGAAADAFLAIVKQTLERW